MKNKFIKALIIVLTLLLIVSIYQTSKYLSMTTKYNTMMSVYDKLPINSYIALKNQDMNLLSSDRPFDDKKINDLFDNIYSMSAQCLDDFIHFGEAGRTYFYRGWKYFD